MTIIRHTEFPKTDDPAKGDTYPCLNGTGTITVGDKLATKLTMNDGALPPQSIKLREKHRGRR